MLHSKNYSGSNQGPAFVCKTLTQLQVTIWGFLLKSTLQKSPEMAWSRASMMQEPFRSQNLTYFSTEK